jgi:hypothetical protein
MAKSYYLPSDDAGKAAWLNNLAAKLPSYQAALGLSAADVAGVTADAAFYAYSLACVAQVSAYSQQWTAYKNSARNGNAPTLGPEPIAPIFGLRLPPLRREFLAAPLRWSPASKSRPATPIPSVRRCKSSGRIKSWM